MIDPKYSREHSDDDTPVSRDRDGNHYSDSLHSPSVPARQIRNISSVVASETRIAILEKIAENHDRRLNEVEEFNRNVVDRLDQKIQLDATNHINLERQLTRAVSSLDVLSTAVSAATTEARSANTTATKLETIGITLLKVGGVLGSVVAAVWVIVTFAITQIQK
jgi:hypothetical protein